jgi:hypothetical protein
MTRLLRILSIAAVLAAAIAVSVSVSACGSSKPKYCSDVTDLQKSLGDFDVSGGLSSVKTQLQGIKSDTDQLISSAKSDFPQQTSAVRTALNRLSTTGQAAVAAPTPANLRAAGADARSLVNAVDTFSSDTKSKCS